VPVATNALGAGLEKLAYLYLVSIGGYLSEDDWERKSSFEARIYELCKYLGIRRIVSTSNINGFVNLRNNSTHARKNRPVADKGASIREALLVFEEAMLSIIGYRGAYEDRTSGNVILQPRYTILKSAKFVRAKRPASSRS
jgi:hypothetical protein